MSKTRTSGDIRIAIVGAGPGGLAAAILLARRGFKVTVFERENRTGGRNASLSFDGYTFDIGPTFFMMPFILEGIFEECGRRLDQYVDLRAIDPFYRLSFADGAEYLPSADPEKTKASIRAMHPPDAEGFDRFMAYHHKKMEALLPCLSVPYDHLFHAMRPKVLNALPVLGLGRTVWEELGRFFEDERVRIAFTFQSKYLGMSPFNCPSLFSILSYTEYRWGVYHPIGGLNRLSAAMEKLAREMGADVRCDVDVSEIDVTNGRATGVRLSGGTRLEFDELVMNADFAWGMRNLIPNAKREKYKDAALDKKKYSCSTYMMYLGVDKRYDHLLHHNVYISSDYRRNLAQIENGGLPDEPSMYVQNAGATDRSLAPEGQSALYVLIPVGSLKTQADWNKAEPAFRRKVFGMLAERAGLKDLEKHIRAERTLTPRTWESRMRVGYGATFNLSHSLDQMLMFRPHNRFEEFENMWLVGGGTHPGSGLPTIYESGRITADGITAKHGGRPAMVPTPAEMRAVNPGFGLSQKPSPAFSASQDTPANSI